MTSHQCPYCDGKGGWDDGNGYIPCIVCAPGLKKQPTPVPNLRPTVWELVQFDLEARVAAGVRTYGVPLQPYNGRDALRDALEECYDLCFYLRQVMFERDGR